jgi:PAS domain S-box-containing protein
MRHYTLACNSIEELDEKIRNFDNTIKNESSVLIQIFSGILDRQKIQSCAKLLKDAFVHAHIIGCTTAGEIAGTFMLDETFTISISIFENASIKSSCIIDSDSAISGQKLAEAIVTEGTKLCILFADGIKLNGEELLRGFSSNLSHDVIVGGGSSGDNYVFSHTFVVYGEEAFEGAVVGVSLSGEGFRAFNAYNLGWKGIGRSMNVTKSDGWRVYEIDGRTPKELYAHYLGEDVAARMPESTIEFPLVFEKDGVLVARSMIQAFDDGSAIYAGNIPTDRGVQFAFGTLDSIQTGMQKVADDVVTLEPEALFVYSCSARKSFFGKKLERELEILSHIVEPIGCYTYGEFFHGHTTQAFLNNTTTIIGLSENSVSDKVYDACLLPSFSKSDVLSHLVNAIAEDLDETSRQNNDNQNILNQYKQMIDANFIVSKTNADGNITFVNEKFSEISGYAKEEMIGQNHRIVRHEEMPAKIFEEMWQTISNKKSWSGVVKNKRKNGEAYSVFSTIAPFLDRKGNIIEYMSIRQDISELEEYRQILRQELDESKKDLTERIHFLREYEHAIDEGNAYIKMSIAGKVIFANDTFKEMMTCTDGCFEYNNYKETLAEESRHLFGSLIPAMLRGEVHKSMVVHKTCDGCKKVYTNAIFVPIKDQRDMIVEIMCMFDDITDLIALQDEIVSTQAEIINTMGEIAEQRSKETGLHVKRVGEYTRLLAEKYGLSAQEVELIRMASPMHDIGKVGIPDDILLKPGKLTVEEFETMKTHAQLGFEMLKHSERPMLKTASTIALTHHEKWDGSGYPNGLKGEDIHIKGRIVAVADVFDALGHDRVYKKAWPLEEILQFFKEQSGKHFDPCLINLFFENLDEFLVIRDKFQDKVD